MPYYNRDPKRDHNFDNHPFGIERGHFSCRLNGLATVRQACEASEKQSTLQQKVQSLEQIKLQGREVLPRPCKSRSPCSKAQQRQDKIK